MSTVSQNVVYEKKELPSKVAMIGWILLLVGLALGGASFAMDTLRTQFVSIILFRKYKYIITEVYPEPRS